MGQTWRPPRREPLAYLGYEVFGGTLRLKEYVAPGGWIWCPDFPGVTVASVPWQLAEGENNTLEHCFPAYDWVQNNGYANLGSWAEAAARTAGR